jgi:hypothetical protein
MIKVLLIILCVISIHILCGIICICRLMGLPQHFTIIDFLLLSLVGPIIVLIWILGEIYCWIISQLNKKKKYGNRKT